MKMVDKSDQVTFSFTYREAELLWFVLDEAIAYMNCPDDEMSESAKKALKVANQFREKINEYCNT